jgi:prepilin signal peptidase PulO-like enzyme (type II secretory pathway)
MAALVFFFGAIIGSFLDVVAMRYNPDKFIFNRSVIGGRSRCMSCGKNLRWFELVPIASYILQSGRCRFCKERISPEHFIVEIISGMIAVAVPYFVIRGGIYLPANNLGLAILSVLWTLAFLALVVAALVDLRISIIPDEINVFLGALGIIIAAFESYMPLLAHGSFMGPYGFLFSPPPLIWMSTLLGFFTGAIFFAILIAITRGRGMGMGDLKLAAALGLLFRFPDILVVIGLAFIIGSIFALYSILRQGKNMKSTISFGPYLSLAALIVFLFGVPLAKAYFSLIGG